MNAADRETQPRGLVYDIQSFSVQDGPGVRTTVFFKGCPLHCPWCHSPESQSFHKQLSWISQRCTGLGGCRSRCMEACPEKAIEAGETAKSSLTGEDMLRIHVRRELCTDCGVCTEKCYPGALSICGTEYTAQELLERVLRDRRFFRDDGGVTLSGGECLCQIEVVGQLLQLLKDEGIHTAVDTTGYAAWETVERVLPLTDLFLYDLKHMDSAKHKAATGVPNERIHENARRIACAGGKMQIRVPVIPRFNDDKENLLATARFCGELGDAVTGVQLLPYHNLGVAKHLRISDEKVMEAVPPSETFMQAAAELFRAQGVPATVH